MIFLVSGNSEDRKSYIHKQIKEAGGDPAKAVRITDTDINETCSFSDLVVKQVGLFGDIEYYIISDLTRSLDIRNILNTFKESPHYLFFSEESVTKPIISAFEKIDATIQSFEKEIVEKKEGGNNIFVLSDLLGARDKKNLWIAYHQALSSSSVEEIIGILNWQLKNMILVYQQPSGVASMKPFVFSKTQRFNKNYSEHEVRELLVSLTKAFHSRDIHHTLEVQVEEIILGL